MEEKTTKTTKTTKEVKILKGKEMYAQLILNAQKNGATRLLQAYTKQLAKAK